MTGIEQSYIDWIKVADFSRRQLQRRRLELEMASPIDGHPDPQRDHWAYLRARREWRAGKRPVEPDPRDYGVGEPPWESTPPTWAFTDYRSPVESTGGTDDH